MTKDKQMEEEDDKCYRVQKKSNGTDAKHPIETESPLTIVPSNICNNTKKSWLPFKISPKFHQKQN